MLLITGSVRRASTNTTALRTVQADAAPGTDCTLYDELAELPHFNPDDEQGALPPPVVRLRDAVHRADAILFSTPEYAGAMPGALKNLLEWLIGDDQPGSVYEKPVGWVNCSPRGAHLAYESLQIVLRYAHAHIVEAACGDVPVHGSSVGEDGLLSDGAARIEVNRLVAALVSAACTERASSENRVLDHSGGSASSGFRSGACQVEWISQQRAENLIAHQLSSALRNDATSDEVRRCSTVQVSVGSVKTAAVSRRPWVG